MLCPLQPVFSGMKSGLQYGKIFTPITEMVCNILAGLVGLMLFVLSGAQPGSEPPHQSGWRWAVVIGTETAWQFWPFTSQPWRIFPISFTIRCARLSAPAPTSCPLSLYISSLPTTIPITVLGNFCACLIAASVCGTVQLWHSGSELQP